MYMYCFGDNYDSMDFPSLSVLVNTVNSKKYKCEPSKCREVLTSACYKEQEKCCRKLHLNELHYERIRNTTNYYM